MLQAYSVYKSTKPRPVEYPGSKTKLPLPPGQTVQPTQPVIDITDEEWWGPRIDMSHKYPYELEPEKSIDMLRSIHIQEWWTTGTSTRRGVSAMIVSTVVVT